MPKLGFKRPDILRIFQDLHESGCREHEARERLTHNQGGDSAKTGLVSFSRDRRLFVSSSLTQTCSSLGIVTSSRILSGWTPIAAASALRLAPTPFAGFREVSNSNRTLPGTLTS